MKFNPTDSFISIQNSGPKEIIWNVYLKQVTGLSGSITGTTGWTNVTSRLTSDSLADISSNIELELAEFTANEVSFTIKGIQWFENNINISVTGNVFIECKVEARLSGSNDVIPMFAGFASLDNIVQDELSDTVEINAFSADEMGNRLDGSLISTQYVTENIVASRKVIQMQNIPAMWGATANLPSFVMEKGIHKIAYTCSGTNSITKSAKLDDGNYQTLVEGENDLLNFGGTQKFRIICQLTSMATSSELSVLDVSELEDNIIILEDNTVIPNQWYQGISTKTLLEKIYSKMGITTVNFPEADQYNNLSISSYDGGSRLTYLDKPPNDPTIIGKARAMIDNGTDVFFAISNSVYKRNQSQSTYSLVTVMDATAIVTKMRYNARKNNLWILADDGEIRIACLDSGLTAKVDASETVNPYCFDLIDFEYVIPSAYHQSAVIVQLGEIPASDSRFMEALWNGSSAAPSLSLVDVSAAVSIPGGQAQAHFIYHATSGSLSSVVRGSRTTNTYQGMGISITNTWLATAGTQQRYQGYTEAAFDESANQIYFLTGGNAGQAGKVIWRHAINSTATDDLGFALSAQDLTWIFSKGIYCIGYTGVSGADVLLFSVTGQALTKLAYDKKLAERISGVIPNNISIVSIPPRVLGLGGSGKLWQYDSNISFFVDEANFSDMSLKEALNKILIAANLVGIITSNKTASVFRRGNSLGVPGTNTASVTATVSNVTSISRTRNKFHAIDFLTINNSASGVTYNGTTFDSFVFNPIYHISIDNQFIPDNILKDIAFYTWKFFSGSGSKNLYTISMDKTPLFQFEPFDLMKLSLTSNTITSNLSGPIYSTKFSKFGNSQFEVLL